MPKKKRRFRVLHTISRRRLGGVEVCGHDLLTAPSDASRHAFFFGGANGVNAIKPSLFELFLLSSLLHI